MEGIELICFNIISSSGMARSLYIQAIHRAKEKNYENSRELINQAKEYMSAGHQMHSKLIQDEAGGEKADICLLLLHAEDQMMSAESFGILAEEFINVYETIYDRELS